jgi:hypothetical protein
MSADGSKAGATTTNGENGKLSHIGAQEKKQEEVRWLPPLFVARTPHLDAGHGQTTPAAPDGSLSAAVPLCRQMGALIVCLDTPPLPASASSHGVQDRVMVVLGCLCAIGHGVLQPLFAILFGEVSHVIAIHCRDGGGF